MKKTLLPLLLLTAAMILDLAAYSQLKPTIRKAVYFDKTPPLREMEVFTPGPRDRSWKEGIIRNEDSERVRNSNPNPLPAGEDPVLQKTFGQREEPMIVANFDGVPNLNSVYPPDTDGDVGPNHYFQMINLSFQIFDKEGNSLYGPADNKTLWNGFIGSWTGTNDGDPIILYDEEADRWVATQFAINTPDGTFWELVAVSETGDPLGAYFRYAFQFPVFNDYPKMGVWPDGYYFSFNMFGSDYRRAAVCALDRDAMLVGDTNARMILFDLPEGSEPWSLLPADFDGPQPPAGTPNYFIYAMDDAFGGGDYLSLYEFVSDWENPENSTFSEVTRLDTEPFNSFFCFGSLGACIPQPDGGPLLEALSDRLMFRLQYRNFGEYEAMVTNHTVNVDGQGHAGIRWYELRDNHDGNGWSIYQQGTYAPDELHRWMGSIAMNGKGYIALGFSVANEQKYPSIRYTGRTPGDPPGQMTFYEEEIIGGTGVQTGSAARWGDYSMMSIDPEDDTTFWFTTEYVRQTGSVSWRTRIAGFRLVEDNIAPAEVTSLAATANTTNSITLNWTATGDDGDTGTAFLYDVRYSTSPITEENFEAAIQAEKEPVPSEAGTPESFVVSGLEFNTTYYFALKVRDRQFNFTGMSNTAQATTPGPPEIGVPELSVTQKIFPGSAGNRSFSIDNTGASDIYYRILKDTSSTASRPRNYGDYADRSRVSDPALDPLFQFPDLQEPSGIRAGGDVRAIYENATYANTGMVWVNGVLYMVDMQKNFLLTYDTAQQALLDTVIIHNSPFGLTWDGEYLWIGDKVGNVYAYNTDGTTAGFSFSTPALGYSTLTWDGNYFLTNFILENDPKIFRIDETGEVIESFQTDLDKMNIWQMVFVDEHYFYGEVWFTNNSGVIGQVMLTEGQGIKVTSFAAPANVSYALTHDNTDLWYGKAGGVIYLVDDGINEVNWLKITPDISVIPASSQKDINLHFDADGFEEGTYHANLVIVSNDQDEEQIRVPVDLLVTGIDLGADTSFCGHLSVVLDAGEGYAGYRWSDGSTGQTVEVDSIGYGLGAATIWVDVTDIGGAVRRDSVFVNFLDCTSIFEFSSGLKVTVFPNPSHGVFELKAENMEKSLDISVRNISGQVIYQKTLRSSDGNKSSLIDLSGFPKGTYLLQVSNNDGLKVQRIILN
jgi:hypothetical protein